VSEPVLSDLERRALMKRHQAATKLLAEADTLAERIDLLLEVVAPSPALREITEREAA
jgi:hypothetical protein